MHQNPSRVIQSLGIPVTPQDLSQLLPAITTSPEPQPVMKHHNWAASEWISRQSKAQRGEKINYKDEYG
jgi:hypothetical protein